MPQHTGPATPPVTRHTATTPLRRHPLFKHWVDADKDGCGTREEVLLTEAVKAPEKGAGCKISGGSWKSLYEETTVEGPKGLDIDHVVPFAVAWDSGAASLNPASGPPRRLLDQLLHALGARVPR
ncbi:hypothetical protein ACIQUL_34245 [Streptomyces sp. NPDC090303]|uniref:hypothetical protein n=1 Tax=Streptomyces sp. NPDC090303 TaxID=3365960 RepID=UPI003800A90D